MTNDTKKKGQARLPSPSAQADGGQVMLLTVLVLAAVFLTATVIAGLLMVYQLSQVTAVADSAKAIFASDAAIERALFKVFRCNDKAIPPSIDISAFCAQIGKGKPLGPLPAFLNGATYSLTISDASGSHKPDLESKDVKSIKATGNSGKAARAFQINF